MKPELNGEVKEALPPLPKGRLATPLEIYVEEARRTARNEAEKRWPLTPENKKDRKAEIDVRVDKAEGYARWRWDGYVNGEISGL